MSKLTVGIVSNRSDKAVEQVKRISEMKDFDKIKVLLFTNGIEEDLSYKLPFNNVKVKQRKTFMECRNSIVMNCKTEFITFIDDDDKFEHDALTVMLDIIEEHPGLSFVGFRFLKEGIQYKNENKLTPIFERDKVDYLSDFDEYETDKFEKVYTRNCSNLYRTNLFLTGPKWVEYGCDDIVPITIAYMDSLETYVSTYCAQRYSEHSTISNKSKEYCEEVEGNMIKAYERLRSESITSIHSDQIIRKSILNSVRQLQVINGYHPKKLLKLLI